ncbi:MAG: alpha-1,2-fucosyltransferase [Bacteroidia bacterium]|nr:alpha-1,2-fucosyltransferase [Bacteroidia bacterium]
MIVVRLMGGLGNQMFQYAFGKMLAIKNGTELKLDLSLLKGNSDIEHYVKRSFDLDIFDLKVEFATESEIAHFNGYTNASFLKKIYHKLNRVLKRRNLWIQNNHQFNRKHLKLSNNICIVGRWQSYKYFESVTNEIRRDFMVNSHFLTESIYTKLILTNNTKAVAVHVRRGDYVSNPYYSRTIGALNVDYYVKAYEYATKSIKGAIFYVFSEDIEWCQKHLDFIVNANFVLTDRSKKGMANDFNLITKCHNHIISNSTFSWWGAWLSENSKGMVIAPTRWAKESSFVPPEIYPVHWIKINNSFEEVN